MVSDATQHFQTVSAVLSLVGGTMALCQGPRASKGPCDAAADCCKTRNHASCMKFHCFLEQLAVGQLGHQSFV